MDQPPQQTGWPQPPMHPDFAPQPAAVPPKKRGFFFRLLIVFFVFVLVGSLMLNGLLMTVVGLLVGEGEGRVQEKFVSHNRNGTEKVAIFSIEGAILGSEGFFRQQLDHARKDIEEGNLKAIVVRVNSPGGTISGSDAMLHYLRELAAKTHIPLVVSMGASATSGGYYVAMCVGNEPDTILAEPSTWTGSIGVLIPHFNVEDLIQKWGIQVDTVASDPLKTMGSMAKKMTPQERKIFQQLVDEGLVQFKDAVKKGRPKFQKDSAALDRLATGQVYTAKQALDSGLIDKIGFIEDAVDRAIKLAKLDKEKVKVVKYKAEPRISDVIFGQSRIQPSFDLAAMLDSAAPRAYYICTWLPVIAGTEK
jgi:protease IV